MEPLAPETIADRYRVLREIGRGGMGSVWLCRDERLGREVAVKRVGALPGESSLHAARALLESRSSAALNHPHVVAVYDAVEEGDQVWLVMEHLPSRNLSQVIAEEGPLPPARLAAIGAQVADGLAAAHERGTVHRDVKPGNVLVTDDDLAKISDFGIARTTGEDQLTQTGMVSGTPLYFSPQLARGEDPTSADDVWALGATLYAAVEGHPPWPQQSNSIAMLAHIAREQPPAPDRAGPLAGTIGRMMDREPGARPSMAEVTVELRALADGDPGEAATVRTPVPAPEPAPAPAPAPAPTPAPLAGAAASPARRRPGILAVAALVLAVVVAGGLVLLLGPLGDEGTERSGRSGDSGTDASAGSGQTPRERSPESSATSSPEPSPTPEETEPAEPGPSEGPPPTRGGPQGFIEDYYAALPEDTEAGWARLAPGFQQEVGGYEDYAGFWRTIDSVRVDGTRMAGPGVVEVRLTYDAAEQEVRQISVERADGGYLIVDDQVVD